MFSPLPLQPFTDVVGVLFFFFPLPLTDPYNQEFSTNGVSAEGTNAPGDHPSASADPGSSLEPTQRLSDARRLGLFYDGPSY